MIDSYLRQRLDKVLIDPIVHKIRISPKKATLLSLFFGILITPLLALHHNAIAFLLLLTSGYFDILDGSLARAQNTSSNLGAVLDIVSDRIVEFSVVIGLFLAAPETRGLVCLLMLGSILICVTSFLVVGIFEQNNSHKSFHYSPGIMERAEAFIFFSLMILFPNQMIVLGVLFSSLVMLTALIRIYQFQTSSDV